MEAKNITTEEAHNLKVGDILECGNTCYRVAELGDELFPQLVIEDLELHSRACYKPEELAYYGFSLVKREAEKTAEEKTARAMKMALRDLYHSVVRGDAKHDIRKMVRRMAVRFLTEEERNPA